MVEGLVGHISVNKRIFMLFSHVILKFCIGVSLHSRASIREVKRVPKSFLGLNYVSYVKCMRMMFVMLGVFFF